MYPHVIAFWWGKNYRLNILPLIYDTAPYCGYQGVYNFMLTSTGAKLHIHFAAVSWKWNIDSC